ncbi:MAG: 30S ribosomal protein S6 [Thermodesulfobacteriota bacterium]|nr:30S ribosomal protein S6 [Thermodesulfobacteriota bacterium]
MRRYETVFIADPDLSGDAQTQLFEKTKNIIADNNGVPIDFDEWGNRRLAYEIKKKQRGHYVRLDYCGDGTVVSALENAFRIDERILKFMTIFVADNADPEAIKTALETERQTAEGTTAAETAPSPEKTAEAAPAESASAQAAAESAGGASGDTTEESPVKEDDA